MRVPLLILYPLLVHLAVVLRRPWLECLAWCCLYAGIFYAGLRGARPSAWIGLLAFASGSFALTRLGGERWLLYLPSIVLPGLMLSAFAVSLLPGRVPLITRIAAAMHDGVLTREQIHYTRAVTWLWVATTALILAVTLALIAAGSLPAWSLFANVLSYGLLALVLVGEYAFRRVRFPQHKHLALPAFLRGVARHRLL